MASKRTAPAPARKRSKAAPTADSARVDAVAQRRPASAERAASRRTGARAPKAAPEVKALSAARLIDLAADGVRPEPTPESLQKRRYGSYLRGGGALMNLILLTAQERELPIGKLTKELQIAPQEWRALERGVRSMANLPRERYERIGSWLGRSTVEVMILAGHLKEDDLRPKGEIDDVLLQQAYKAMQEDPYMLGITPSADTWATFPKAAKVVCVLLHQYVSRAQFIRAMNVPKVEPAPAPAAPRRARAARAKA
jgi:hypothetical protein